MFIELTAGGQKIAVNIDSIETFVSNGTVGGARIGTSEGGYYDVNESYLQIWKLIKGETDNG